MGITHIKQALREEIAAKTAKIADLVSEREVLERSLASLGGNGAPKRRAIRRRRGLRKSQQEILDLLRRQPDRAFSAIQLSDELGMSRSTAYAAMSGEWGTGKPASSKGLVPAGKVTVVGKSKRGGPVVRHKPITIRPGEKVAA